MGAGMAGPAAAQSKASDAAAGGPIMLLPPAASPGTDSEPSQPVPTSTNPASANTAQSATLNAGAAVARPPAVREGTETGPRTVGGIVIGNLAAPDAEAARVA